MRFSSFVAFLRFIGAFGAGAYFGAAAAGLVAVVTGRVFAPGSTWVAALPFLVILGAVLTAGAAWLTRLWLLPKLRRRRKRWGAAAGVVLTPLAVAFGELGDLAPLGVVLVLIGAVTTAVLWVRWFRARLYAAAAR
ncbi:hypothetical protein C8D87_114132 [Lentzea atacamensis]|uniref:Integral membrane protein n=1 Tax=Lentzea atacamensis TaxID=531938 RepID=A0ABX9DW50_9PSEU|nr:hypothetical protein [Lentzea atacamensis]RAS59520.1 hypothetical protein C8D87_114132 [Lentzea atacamensis]